MPKNQLGIKQPLQSLDHLQAMNPCIMISGQPPMGVTQLIILRDMELIGRPDPRARLFEIDLHHDQPRCMSWRVVQRDTLEQIHMLLMKGIPFQLGQIHVSGEIDSQIGTRGNRPARVLEFLFMHVDWHVGAHEVLKPAGMIEM